MVAAIRLMPHHDPHWRERLAAAKSRQAALLGREGLLTAAEQAELLALRQAVEHAFNARFRTTAEYRDYHFSRARELLAAEGIDLPIPVLGDDATLEEIDRVLELVRRAVELTDCATQ